MKGVLDSMELRILRRVDNMRERERERERNFLRETHVQSRMEHSQ